MDAYAKFAAAQNPRVQESMQRQAAEELDAERKAEEHQLRCLDESYKIDASQISLEDLDQVNGDWNNYQDVAMLWALGRYLLQKDRDFTNQAEMNILQKYLDIINPEIHPNAGSNLFPKSRLNEYSNDGFSCPGDYIYRYYDFLQKLHMTDEQLVKVLERHPCPSSNLFIKRPELYTKQSAQQVVEQKMRYFHGFDKEFQQMKKAYVENFGDDFDAIMVDTDNKKGIVKDILREYVKEEKYFCPEFEYAPEYIVEFLPELSENNFLERVMSRYVTEENKDGLVTLLKKKQVEELEKLQNKTDQFFEQEGNLKYILLGRNELKRKQPEIAKNPNLADVIYSYYIRARGGIEYELLLNLKRIKEDKRDFIVLEVPQDMIGMVVGKGGRNIKELEQKFGKKFKVVQSSKEKEEQKRKQHQEDLQKLQRNVINEVGDYVIIASEDDMRKSISEYMDVHKKDLPFVPSVEEMEGIYKALTAEKERKIAEQKRIEAERAEQHRRDLEKLQDNIKNSIGGRLVEAQDADIAQAMVDYMKENKDNLPVQPNEEELTAIQQNLIQKRDAQIAERKQQDKAAVECLYYSVNSDISNYGWENNYELISDEEVKKSITATCNDNSYNPAFARVAEKTEKEIILLLQKERYLEQEADKRFDKVTAQALEEFFLSDESGGHGEYFFGSVGKARRTDAYDKITNRVMSKLGLTGEENYPLPALQEQRWYRYKEKVVAFEEDYSSSGVYVDQSNENTDVRSKTLEPTLANLAKAWGAGFKPERGK